MRGLFRIGAIAGALVVLMAVASPVSAAPGSQIPPDVAEAFATKALRAAQGSAEHFRGQADADPATREAPDFSGPIRADDIHQVHVFSPEFLDGVATTQPLTATNQWMASVKRGNEVLGTIMVWKPQGGPAELGGFTDDVALGTAFGQLRAGEVLIEDARVASYFALEGNTVRPVNSNATIELPQPAAITDLQAVVAARVAAADAQSSGVEDSAGGGGPVASVRAEDPSWGAGTVLVVALVLTVVVALAVPGRRAVRRS